MLTEKKKSGKVAPIFGQPRGGVTVFGHFKNVQKHITEKRIDEKNETVPPSSTWMEEIFVIFFFKLCRDLFLPFFQRK